MSNTLITIVLIALLLLWGVGYFVLNLSSFVHLILMIALVIFLFKFLK